MWPPPRGAPLPAAVRSRSRALERGGRARLRPAPNDRPASRGETRAQTRLPSPGGPEGPGGGAEGPEPPAAGRRSLLRRRVPPLHGALARPLPCPKGAPAVPGTSGSSSRPSPRPSSPLLSAACFPLGVTRSRGPASTSVPTPGDRARPVSSSCPRRPGPDAGRRAPAAARAPHAPRPAGTSPARPLLTATPDPGGETGARLRDGAGTGPGAAVCGVRVTLNRVSARTRAVRKLV